MTIANLYKDFLSLQTKPHSP